MKNRGCESFAVSEIEKIEILKKVAIIAGGNKNETVNSGGKTFLIRFF
jgi:hypothetical protein